MGRCKNGKYYRGKDDADLQWLEDGVNVVGQTLVFSVFSIFIGVFQIVFGLVKILFTPKA
jgi:hypothetical protein